MTIELYIPSKLQSEIDRFKEQKGNINLDYRSLEVSAPYVLGTPFQKVTNEETLVNLGVAPFTVGTSHVSGDINNYRNFSSDFLIENKGIYQTNVVVMNTFDNIVVARYSTTTAVKLGARNTLVHAYTLMKNVDLGVTLVPVQFEGQRSFSGVVDKKICERLTSISIPSLMSINLSGNTITIVQESSKDSGHNIVIPYSEVEPYIVDITRFTYKDVSSKSTSKLRLVSGVSKDFVTEKPSPLSELTSNYNLYYNETSNTETAEGYCISLKPGECALFNTAIQTTLEAYTDVVPLGIGKVLISDSYTGGLSTYFSSLNFKLPLTVPKDNLGDSVPFRIRVDGIIHYLPSYIEGEFSLLCKDIKNILSPLSIEVYERSDNTLFLFSRSSKDIEITIAYIDFNIETKEDVSTVESVLPQPPLQFSEDLYPSNLSLSLDQYIDTNLFRKDGEGFSPFFCMSLYMKSNPSKMAFGGLFNYAKYTINRELFTGEEVVFTFKINEEDVTIPVTLTDSDTLLANVKDLLQPQLSSIRVEVDEVSGTITFYNKLTSYTKLVIRSAALTVDLDYNGLYELFEGSEIYELSGEIV